MLAETGSDVALGKEIAGYGPRAAMLFNRAKAFGHVKENPVKQVKRVREQERPVPALSVDEQNALLAACSDRIITLSAP